MLLALATLATLAGTAGARVEVRIGQAVLAAAAPVAPSGTRSRVTLRVGLREAPEGDTGVTVQVEATARIRLSAAAACDFLTGSDGGCARAFGTPPAALREGGLAEVARLVGGRVSGWVRGTLL
jgi:hypothetical protein